MKTFPLSPILTILLLAIPFVSHSQAFQKGTKLLDAGFEVQNSFEESVVPVFVNFEAAVSDDIGVGAKIRYWTKLDLNSLVIQANGNYHFGRIMKLKTDKLDVFAGLGMGVNRIWVSEYGDLSFNSFIISPSVGARYFFTDKIGATAKLTFDNYGYDYGGYYSERYTDASFALGISFRF